MWCARSRLRAWLVDVAGGEIETRLNAGGATVFCFVIMV